MDTQPTALPFNVASLVFINDAQGRFLLLERNKAPNKGLWSPIGGKAEIQKGESPFECAVRETFEETGLSIETQDLHLFAMVTERAYECCGHWLMFLFRCKKPIPALPPNGREGRFEFFERAAIDALAIPETDRQALWTLFDEHQNDFVALRADFKPDGQLEIHYEQRRMPHETPLS